MAYIHNWLIRLNNRITIWRNIHAEPEQVMVLLPHCLQRRDCTRKLTGTLDNCAQCGNCDIAAILQTCVEFQLPCHLAAGGREALARVKHPKVRAIVAVACEKELIDGILAVFPKPVFAIPLSRPEGPCKNTRVDLPMLAAAVQQLLS